MQNPPMTSIKFGQPYSYAIGFEGIKKSLLTFYERFMKPVPQLKLELVLLL
jgi:hypothetical protein